MSKTLKDYLFYEEPGITLYCGDCRKIIPLLQQPTHVISDPPYSQETHGGAQTQTRGIMRPLISFAAVDASYIASVLEMANPSRWAVLTCDWRHALPLEALVTRLRFIRLGVWTKPDGCPQFTGDRPAQGWEAVAILHSRANPMYWNDGGQKAVWTFHVGRSGLHPTEKPIGLLLTWVKCFTNPGDVILDPFMGSGTTIIAAKEMGRRAIGIEIEPKYCEIAVKRLRQERLQL